MRAERLLPDPNERLEWYATTTGAKSMHAVSLILLLNIGVDNDNENVEIDDVMVEIGR
jgi:hypothetical protein